MRNLLKRLDYSVVASTLALFVALGGTSYAAVKITGATIKDNSVSGKDVRDRSLKAADFKSGALPAGPPGPVGPAGPAGRAGARGEAGPSEVISRIAATTAVPATTPGRIVSLPLPAGEWVVTASGLADNGVSTDRTVRCRVMDGGRTLADVGTMKLITDSPGSGFPDSASFTIPVPFRTEAPKTLELACSSSGTGTVIARPHLMATRVGTLNLESGD